jgi:hypothetical protein
VESYRNGPAHVFVKLAGEEAVAALRPEMAVLNDLGVAANCFAGRGRFWKTRMFYPAAAVGPRWEQEDGLGEVQLTSEALHLLGTERPPIDEDGELVAFERIRGEDVADEVRMQRGRSVPVPQPGDDRGPSRHLIVLGCRGISLSGYAWL